MNSLPINSAACLEEVSLRFVRSILKHRSQSRVREILRERLAYIRRLRERAA